MAEEHTTSVPHDDKGWTKGTRNGFNPFYAQTCDEWASPIYVQKIKSKVSKNIFVCETFGRVQDAKKTVSRRADYGQFQNDRIITGSDMQLKDYVAMIGH
jgi:hypothetical protein